MEMKYLHVIILFFAVHFCNAKEFTSPIKPYIIGGSPVPIEQHPSFVQLHNNGAFCGGNIIHSWAVLTAAHCFDKSDNVLDMFVQVGTRYTIDLLADMHDVWHIVTHEDYNKTRIFACDIAIIFLDTPLVFGPTVMKIVIVNTGKWMRENNDNNFTVAGWGITQNEGPTSGILMVTTLRYVNRNTCGKQLKVNITEDMFCLYGDGITDACKGDSGGGALWNGMIAGLVSHGGKCATKDRPSVYVNVWFFRNWIWEQLKKFETIYCDDATKRGLKRPRAIQP